MTPKQLSKKISELCLHREQLQQERTELAAEFEAAKQLPKVSESVKQTAKLQSQAEAIDAELVILDSMIEDESCGLDSAISTLRKQVTADEQDHQKNMRQALSEFLQSDKVAEARKTIAAVEALVYEVNPMIDFETHDACKQLLRNSRELQTVALAELVTLPEEKPAPPELSLLVEAQRAIRDNTEYTIVTAGSEPPRGMRQQIIQPTDESRQKVKDEIEAKRQEREQRLQAMTRDKETEIA